MNEAVVHVFRLYVAGRSFNSAQAIDNLRTLCREYLPDGHEIQIVDVLREPGTALREGIVVTPTLVRLRPEPLVRIIGNLGQKPTVLASLGLETATS